MKVRVADYIAEFLYQKGIRATFFVSGGGMMHLIDAVGKHKGLQYYCSHHEQAAAMAADAYARRTGGIGACYVTSGPGGTNAITGVVEAWLDSSPVIFISGQSKLSQTIRGNKMSGLRQFGTFEVDIIPIVQSITKYAVFLDDAKMIRHYLEKAYFFATTGRPGPVWIDVPIDLQGFLIETECLPCFEFKGATGGPLEPQIIENILRKIRDARRPLLFAGHGVKAAGERERFRRLVDILNIPVATTPFAVDLLSYENPLFVGHPSLKGDRAGNFAVQNADLIITLGNSLHVMTTGYEIGMFAPTAYKIMIDLDEFVLNRQEVHIDEKIQCSVENFLDAIGKKLSNTRRFIQSNEWHEYCLQIKSELSVKREPHNRPKQDNGKTSINYFDLIDVLSDLTNGTETIVTDAGLAFYLVGQSFRVKDSQFVINSGGLGTMGFALPASIGACVARRDLQTICITGDGSLQANLQELASIRRYSFDLKMFIVNNGGYVSIRNTQNQYFSGYLVGSSPETGVWLPSLKRISEAYELPYLAVDSLEDLALAVRKTLVTPGPVICEIYTPHEAEVIPTVTSTKLSNGQMVSKPLHEMYPFLSTEQVSKYMIKDRELKLRKGGLLNKD